MRKILYHESGKNIMTELEIRIWDNDWIVVASKNSEKCLCVQFKPSSWRDTYDDELPPTIQEIIYA